MPSYDNYGDKPNRLSQKTDSTMSGLFGSAASSASSSNPTQGDLSKDVPVPNGPEDSISDLVFSPASEHFSVSSWDGKVRIYAVDGNGQSSGVAMLESKTTAGAPMLNTCWSSDGQKVFGASADKGAYMLDLGAGKTQPSDAVQIAVHDQPIKCVETAMVGGNPMLITGGWDKMVKYWDLRQPPTGQPAGQLECNERIYTMDVKDNMLVVGTADRWIHVVNLANPGTSYKAIQSPLKWQTRVCTIFHPEPNGYAIGSIEGRCAIQYVEDKDQSNNFSFKCHRATPPTDRNVSNVFAVNAISFHPVHGTFSTAGSDGTFHFWDKDAKHRLKGYPEVGGPITATDFDRSGNIFAYAVSYDWSKGYQGHTQAQQGGQKDRIMLHPVTGDECKPRPKGGKR
jgi:mRNA export factor